MKKKSEPIYYWIAINGASCAMPPCPLPLRLNVNPVPQLLLGFVEREEALEQLRYLMSAPIKDVHRRVAEFAERARRHEIVCIKPTNPQPPQEITLWEVDGRAAS